MDYVKVGESEEFRFYAAPTASGRIFVAKKSNPQSRASIPRRMAENGAASLSEWVRPQFEASAMAALYRERFGA